MKVEIRHVVEKLRDKGHPYLTFSVFLIDDSGHEEELENEDFYPDARRLGKAHAVKRQAQLFDVDENGQKREVSLSGLFPSRQAVDTPTNRPQGFSIHERSTGTEIIFPDLPVGIRVPHLISLSIFVLAVSALGFSWYLFLQNFSAAFVFLGLFSVFVILRFNPLNIWYSIQPRKNEVHLGTGGILHRNIVGKKIVEEKIGWNEVEDIFVSKDIDTNLWDLRIVTEDDEFYLWTSEIRTDLDWLKQTICFAARQYYR